MKFFYEPKGYGDPEAVRFESGSKELTRYHLPCKRLTVPYSTLTWLMKDYIESYYLADTIGYESNSSDYWIRSESSPMFQYEIRINRSGADQARFYCSKVVDIYLDLEQNGFNLAKPVPVAENPAGQIVPLKGAKRIAGLMAHGIESVPVLEFERGTLSNIPEEQRYTTCIDHSSLIFEQLGDLSYVQSLRKMYSEAANSRGPFEQALVDRLASCSRPAYPSNADRLASQFPFSSKPGQGGTYAHLIGDDWETLLWLYRRELCSTFVLIDTDSARALEPLARNRNITLIIGQNGEIDLTNARIERLSLPSSLRNKFHIKGLEAVREVLIS